MRSNYDILSPRRGTSLFKPYRYEPPQRVWFSRLFGLKTDIHFAHFGLESGIVFQGTAGVYERIFSFQFQMNKKERVTYELKGILRNLVLGVLI